MIKTKTVNVIDFSDIFRYAEKFGVRWNPANDLFFNVLFDYRSIDEVDYSGEYAEKSIEEISEMEDGHDKAQAIFDCFVDDNNLSGTFMVDSK